MIKDSRVEAYFDKMNAMLSKFQVEGVSTQVHIERAIQVMFSVAAQALAEMRQEMLDRRTDDLTGFW